MRLLIEHMPLISIGFPAITALFTYFLYGAIFVGIRGQTLGMTIMDLRVVTTRFVRPSPVQALWRYAMAVGSVLTAFVLLGSSSAFIRTTGFRERASYSAAAPLEFALTSRAPP